MNSFQKQWEELSIQARKEVEFISDFITRHPEIKIIQIHDSISFDSIESCQIFMAEFERFFPRVKPDSPPRGPNNYYWKGFGPPYYPADAWWKRLWNRLFCPVKEEKMTRCNDFYIDHKTGTCEALGRVPTEKDCKKCTCPTKDEKLPPSCPAGHREGGIFNG